MYRKAKGTPFSCYEFLIKKRIAYISDTANRQEVYKCLCCTNGRNSNTIKRDKKYTKPISLQETSPRKYASLKSKIEEQSILFLFPVAEHNFLMCTLYLSIWSTNKSMDAVSPPKTPCKDIDKKNASFVL